MSTVDALSEVTFVADLMQALRGVHSQAARWRAEWQLGALQRRKGRASDRYRRDAQVCVRLLFQEGIGVVETCRLDGVGGAREGSMVAGLGIERGDERNVEHRQWYAGAYQPHG